MLIDIKFCALSPYQLLHENSMRFVKDFGCYAEMFQKLLSSTAGEILVSYPEVHGELCIPGFLL